MAATTEMRYARPDGVALFSRLLASNPHQEAGASLRSAAFAAALHLAIVAAATYSPESDVPVPADSTEEAITLIVPDLAQLLGRVKEFVKASPAAATPAVDAPVAAEPLSDDELAALEEMLIDPYGQPAALDLAVALDLSLVEELLREGRELGEMFDFELPPQLKMSMQELESEPTFTPYTAGPILKNRERVRRDLDRQYPMLLLESGIGGTVVLWFLIDADGRIRRTLIKDKSTFKSFDDVAMRVAKRMEFSPALHNGLKVPVWISLPVEFRAGP